MTSIFIFGLFQSGSGKTTVSTALTRAFVNEGQTVGVFKPRSGHNIWYHQTALMKGKADSRLFGEDIIKLKEASRCPLPYEVLNPIVALMSPSNYQTFLERKALNQMYLQLSNIFMGLYFERYTFIEDGSIKTTLLVNEHAINGNFILQDPDYLAKLKARANEVVPLHNLHDWSVFYNKFSSRSIYSCYQKVEEYSDILIIEGFNDAISPEPRILPSIGVIIGVAPGKAVFYDSDEFKKVISTLKDLGKDIRSLRAEELVKYLKKYEIMDIPAILLDDLMDYDKLSKKVENVINFLKRKMTDSLALNLN
ncbi:MAG: hypothetical protein ACFFC7_30090 [Candidatus Hermodarchaeota archaeon]